MSTDRFDTPSGAASGKFHVEQAAASATSGATCFIGRHKQKKLEPRCGVLGQCELRLELRAPRGSRPGDFTVLIDRFETPSGAASGKFHV